MLLTYYGEIIGIIALILLNFFQYQFMLNGKKLIDNVNPKILVCLIITKSTIGLEQSLFFYNVYVLKLPNY